MNYKLTKFHVIFFLLVILSLFIMAGLHAQTKIIISQGTPNQIYKAGAYASDSAMYITNGCGAPTLPASYQTAKRGAMAYYDTCNNLFYIYNPDGNLWGNVDFGNHYVTTNTTQDIPSIKNINPSFTGIDGSHGFRVAPVITASGNNQTIYGSIFNPTLNTGGFTGVQRFSLYLRGGRLLADSTADFNNGIETQIIRPNQSIITPMPANIVFQDTAKRITATYHNTPDSWVFGRVANNDSSLYGFSVQRSAKFDSSITATGLSSGTVAHGIAQDASGNFIQTAPTSTDIVTFATTDAMQVYTGSATSAFVQNKYRGGWFVLGHSATTDSAIIFSATGLGSDFVWIRQYTQTGKFVYTWWPNVQDDSLTDCSAGMQQANNYANRQGGGTMFLPKINKGIYLFNNDTLKSGVHIYGGDDWEYEYNVSDTNAAAANASHDIELVLNGPGELFSTPPAPASGNVSLNNASLRGLTLVGLGSGIRGIGIHTVSTRNVKVSDCYFRNFSHSAIVQDSSYTHHLNQELILNNVRAQFCMLKRDTLTNYTGVLDLHGDDNHLDNVEVNGYGGSNTPPTSSGYVCAISIRGSNGKYSNDIWEAADVDMYLGGISSYRNQFNNNIWDNPQKEAIIVDTTNENTIQGIVTRPGLKTNNTYVGVSLRNGSARNKISIYGTNLGGSAPNLPKYMFSDSLVNSTAYSGNNWIGSFASLASFSTSMFAPFANAAGSIIWNSGAGFVDASVTGTPDVNGKGTLIYNSSTTITNFLNGNSSQTLQVLLLNSTTISNNSNISLSSGANFTYPANSLVRFVNYAGKWYEQSVSGAITVSTGTTGSDVGVSGSPVSLGGTVTINIPTASASVRGALSSTDWNTFNNKQSTISLTTTGTNGVATFAANTLNVPYYIIDSPEHTYSGSVTWSGTTAPSGSTNHTYQWQRTGNKVTVTFHFSYSVAGSNVSSLSFPLPSDLPAVKTPAGYAGNNDVLYTGSGSINTSLTAQSGTSMKSYLTINAASNGWNMIIAASAGSNALVANCTMEYFVQ